MGQRTLSILLGLLLASGIAAPQARSQCWIFQKTGIPITIGSVSFFDSATGYLAAGGVNSSGRTGLFQTTNGGADWEAIYWGGNPRIGTVVSITKDSWIASADDDSYGPVLLAGANGSPMVIKYRTLVVLDHLCFPDPGHGIGVGRMGMIWTTSDGGIRWTQRNAGTFEHLYGVSFVDSSIGIAVGGATDSALGLILRTTNGGADWQTMYTGQQAVLYGAAYLNIYDAVVVGNRGTILRTSDGGYSWVTYQSDTSFTFTNASFRDARHGIVVGQGYTPDGTPAGVIFSTSDGGASWDSLLGPSTTYFDVSYADSTHGTIVGSDGDMIRMTTDCGSSFSISPRLPFDGTPSQLLILRDSLQYTAQLSWDFSPHRIEVSGSRVQLSTDSAFAGGVVMDTPVPLERSRLNTAVTAGHLRPGQTYYWRVALSQYDGSATGWSAVSRFTAASGTLSGTVYADLDLDSLQDGGEPGLAHWPVIVSGKVQSTVYTDSLGRFTLSGLDSGTFVVSGYQRPGGGVLTYPPAGQYAVTIGLNGAAGGMSFGEYYPWNSIGGVVYLDENENGLRDAGEPGMAHWPVHLEGSESNSYTVITDSSGSYQFPCVYAGASSVSLFQQPPWEQELPYLGGSYSFDIQSYGRHVGGADFAVHKISPRVKLALTVSDSTPFAHRDIWWGVRPGATYGIWGVDSGCTAADFSEGEFELPPALSGMFDARFRDPRRSDLLFGNGSWTDMRPYVSPAQADTYLVRFVPGLAYGGGYPMTLRWRHDLVAAAYAGAVTLVDPAGVVTDMKTADSLVVSDPAVTFLTLAARDPILPTLDVREGPSILPGQFRLRQNYPNPFNPSTTITFDLPRRSRVTLTVYDLLGRELVILASGTYGAGSHSVVWDGGALPSGVYFYQLAVSGGARMTQKMVLLR